LVQHIRQIQTKFCMSYDSFLLLNAEILCSRHNIHIIYNIICCFSFLFTLRSVGLTIPYSQNHFTIFVIMTIFTKHFCNANFPLTFFHFSYFLLLVSIKCCFSAIFNTNHIRMYERRLNVSSNVFVHCVFDLLREIFMFLVIVFIWIFLIQCYLLPLC